MDTHKIAEVTVNLEAKEKTLNTQRKAYRTDRIENADITIDISDEFLKERQSENPYLTLDECEYIWTGLQFYYKLLEFNGFMLHSSAVAMGGEAYLFSAKSGTGKSTHTELWQKYFGEDKVLIVNDDKPAVRLVENKFYIYGTPWSGKTDKNLNIKVPLKAIIFIERSEKSWIKKIESKDAIKLILDQTIRPREIEKVDELLNLINELLKIIPIYKMGCDISKEAVEVAYNKLKIES